MSVFSIILLSLLGAYLIVWSVDKFIVTPRREIRHLPEIDERLKEVEKKLDELAKEDADESQPE